MQLKPFLLDAWIDQYEHDIEFNLAASTGPTWTVNDILALADDATRHRFLNHKLVYGHPGGNDSLREAIAQTRSLAHGLSPVNLGSGGLLEALGELAGRMSKDGRIKCIFDCSSPVLVKDSLAEGRAKETERPNERSPVPRRPDEVA